MAKISVVVLADTETHGDLGRLANALQLVKEASEAGDETELVFDGAGTKWPGELTAEDHDLNPLYEQVRSRVAGACEYCAGAFHAKEGLERADVPLLDEYEGHPSLRQRLADGFQVVTF